MQPTLSTYYPLAQRAEHGLSALITEGSVDGVISGTSNLGWGLMFFIFRRVWVISRGNGILASNPPIATLRSQLTTTRFL